MTKWIGLASGGILGTFARYLLAGAVYRVWGASFPYGTLIVNLTGWCLIGFLTVLSEEKFLLGPTARIFLMIGFCGAYTTFSTFIFETANLMKDGENLRALTNVLLSVLLGFVALRIGILLGRLI
jgi:CrcB protein